ncbi:MAG: hypothetical protein C5B58_05000 [Acidobacteria bacterium]|nr:MAG: hypothetical protein C5B58_05000 [Acidobacteriota bacterium]
MFETLEDALEKSKPPLDRGVPILAYSILAVLSFVFLVVGVERHGFSRLLGPVVWAVMFLLSLNWLITSLRSSVPISRSDFWVHYKVLWFLLLLAGILEDTLR